MKFVNKIINSVLYFVVFKFVKFASKLVSYLFQYNVKNNPNFSQTLQNPYVKLFKSEVYKSGDRFSYKIDINGKFKRSPSNLSKTKQSFVKDFVVESVKEYSVQGEKKKVKVVELSPDNLSINHLPIITEKESADLLVENLNAKNSLNQNFEGV